MQPKTLFILALLSLSTYSFGYFTPMCGQSYLWDSYGMGLKSAFNYGQDSRANLNDESCYQAGFNFGFMLLDDTSSVNRCRRDFQEGLSAGVKYKNNHNIANKCFSAGHTAGVAKLQIATREGDAAIAGVRCIDAYLAGKNDFYTRITSINFSASENKLRNCYQQGLYEAPMVP